MFTIAVRWYLRYGLSYYELATEVPSPYRLNAAFTGLAAAV